MAVHCGCKVARNSAVKFSVLDELVELTFGVCRNTVRIDGPCRASSTANESEQRRRVPSRPFGLGCGPDIAVPTSPHSYLNLFASQFVSAAGKECHRGGNAMRRGWYTLPVVVASVMLLLVPA